MSALEFHFADGESEAPTGSEPRAKGRDMSEVPFFKRCTRCALQSSPSVSPGKREGCLLERGELGGTEGCLTILSPHWGLLPLLMVAPCCVPMLSQSADQHKELIQARLTHPAGSCLHYTEKQALIITGDD